MTANTSRSVGLALAISVFGGGAAVAQDYALRLTSFAEFGAFEDYNRNRNVTVLERDRPEYAAIGFRRGAFEFFPRVETALNYDDNVFATDAQKQSDVFATIDPSITFNSTWSRHSVDGGAGVNHRHYFDFSSENQTGYYARLNGQLEVVGDSYVRGGLSTQRAFEPRTASGSPTNAVEPIEFDSSGLYARGVYQFGRMKAGIGGDYREVDYKNGRTPTGAVVSQADRDRTISNLRATAEYGITPDFSVFGLVGYSDSDYDVEGGLAVSRDSEESSVMGGASFDFTGLVRGAVGIGYSQRDYDADAYPDIDGLNFRGKIEYLPTPLTTITVSAARSVEDSTIIGSGGYFARRAELRVDHELRRFVLVRAGLSYEEDRYKGADRSDDITEAAVGGTYLLSNSAGLSADVVYSKRVSDGAFAGRDYDALGFRVSFVLQR
ncbi:hypothetical protein BZG35_05675 [Brevundimonas sp. LM2]|uniref:outer membrane beta-barrel protein n=1 Tax=Brevundimonas sp. LM2 TaxID=1938605 RepID=UPI0009838F13|nr:outer membrane beta-barrel protein [Brevundimonas sp. LM2]AQR61197.1 hypothetical protein BZG35_05675 [Brevundimonas sp. LM2]